MTTRRMVWAVVLVAAVGATGCDLFRPEVPPPPTGNAVVEDFSTPARLLNTVADAIANKGPSGQTAYASAFAESTAATTRAFYAFHWPAVVDNWRQLSQREPPNPWDLALERNFYSYLIGVYETFDYTLVWDRDPGSPNDEIDESAGTALLHRQYQLVASSTTTTEQKRIAVGFADLYLYRSSGRWFLYRWEDRIDPAIGISPADPDELSMGARRLDSQSNR